jgi:hypothetical protein
LLHIRNTFDFLKDNVFNKDPRVRIFPDFHFGFDVLSQQVMDLLVINFNRTTLDEVGFQVALAFDDGHDLGKGTGDYALTFLDIWSAHHCESFATPGLPVCEYGPVVTVQDTVNQGECTLLIN